MKVSIHKLLLLKAVFACGSIRQWCAVVGFILLLILTPYVCGSVLAFPPSNTITRPNTTNSNLPAFVNVILHVNNTGGGTAIPSDFNVVEYGTHANPGMFAGSEKGTIVAMDPGSYSLSIIPNKNLNTTYGTSYSGSCALNMGWYETMGMGGAKIRAGEKQICTITEIFPNFK